MALHFRLPPARFAAPLLLGAALSAWPPGMVQAQVSASGASSNALPALGDAAAQEMSPMAERKLGDRIMRSILRDPDMVDDPLVLEYVDQVWQSLLRAARRRGDIGAELDASHAWEPFLVRDRSVNAFALPGGYIGVHFGLLAMTVSPDELGSVLAHELSHVTQRHIARMVAQESRQSWVSLASLILGVLAASRNPQAAQAMIYGGQAVAIQGQLNFSRDMEREADRVGFGVLGDAGYEPSGMAVMFEHLQQASRLNDDGSYPYLRTHPLTTERIGDARARLGPNGWQTQAKASDMASTLWAQHTMMAARSRVLMDTRSESLHKLINPDTLKDHSSLGQITALYAAGLAAQRTGDAAHASSHLSQALASLGKLPAAQQNTVRRVLVLAQAETLLSQRKAGDAAALLSKEQARAKDVLRPGARPESLLMAHVALALPDGKEQAAACTESASRLQTLVSNQPHDVSAWSVLAEVWQKLGEPVRAIRAEAEATAAQGDLPGAIDRVQGAHKRIARPTAAEAIELSVMDARMKVWQRQQREDLRDERNGA